MASLNGSPNGVTPPANGLPGPARPPHPGIHDAVSLDELLEIVAKGKWLIALSVALVVGATAAYTFLTPPEYEASSMLYVNSQQSSPQIGDLLGLELTQTNLANEIGILESRSIAKGVAQRLQSYGAVPGTGEPLTVLEEDEEEPVGENDVVERLQDGYVSVSPLNREAELIKVTVTSTEPAEAALIADLYAEEFVEYNRTLSRARMTASREFLTEVTDRFQGDLERAEQDMTAFLNQERVVAPDEEAKQLLEQVMQLQQLQYQTQSELGMARAEAEALRAEIEQVVPGLSEKISSGDDLMIDRLIEQVAAIDLEVEQRYARNPALRDDPSADPNLGRLLDEAASLKQELQRRADRLVEDAVASGGVEMAPGGARASSRDRLSTLQELRRQMMEKEVVLSGLQARQDVVDEQLATAQGALGRIPGKEIILNRLERSLETREQLYLALIEKLQEARIAEQSELGYVDIIDEAAVPERPVRPRKAINLALALVLGLMLGLGLAFVQNARDDKVRRTEDLRKAGHSVLTTVPSMKKHIKTDYDGKEEVVVDGLTISTMLVSLLNPLAVAADSYRRLATNLRFAQLDNPVRTALVTSSNAGEGKSSTALNLAITMTQAGKRTVYVDADLYRPTGHTRIGVPREPGLTDLLFDPISNGLDRFATPIEGLSVIPAGRAVPNPSVVFESRKFQALMRQLSEEFDFVVVDSPPLLAVADTLSLAVYSDATVVVCRAAATTRADLQNTVEALASIGVRPAGIVLNDVDPKQTYGGYGYGYREGYRKSAEATRHAEPSGDGALLPI